MAPLTRICWGCLGPLEPWQRRVCSPECVSIVLARVAAGIGEEEAKKKPDRERDL